MHGLKVFVGYADFASVLCKYPTLNFCFQFKVLNQTFKAIHKTKLQSMAA